MSDTINPQHVFASLSVSTEAVCLSVLCVRQRDRETETPMPKDALGSSYSLEERSEISSVRASILQNDRVELFLHV